MPILQQLLVHGVIVTMALGGVACLCPADAGAGPAAVAHAAEAAHGHSGEHATAEDADAGCGHERCGTDCEGATAVSAKAKPTTFTPAGRDAPDGAEFLPAGFAAWPDSAPQLVGSVDLSLLLTRVQDSPVRRFDRLLD